MHDKAHNIWAIAAIAGLYLGKQPAMANAASDAAITKIEREIAVAPNADALVKDYDNDVVVYDMIGNTMTGRKIVRDDYAKLYSGMKDAKLVIMTLAIESDDRFGYAYSTQHLKAKSTQGGPDTDIVLRQTDCFHKVGGRWLIISQHISVPFDPTNGHAVFNSH